MFPPPRQRLNIISYFADIDIPAATADCDHASNAVS